MRRISLGLIAIAALLTAAAARAEDTLVVYSANDANLNRFVFEAFAKETGVIDQIVDNLTLDGLRIIWELNQ